MAPRQPLRTPDRRSGGRSRASLGRERRRWGDRASGKHPADRAREQSRIRRRLESRSASGRRRPAVFLNPDARPAEGSLAALCSGFRDAPRAAGLVPRLVGFDGAPQAGWQLRRLPSAPTLLAHALFWNPSRGPAVEPAAGTPIEQPAAAALALRRSVFEAVGGFDESFFPAWFEDVDLARRLADQGSALLYFPAALCTHRQGSSVAALGYGAFLTAYDRNLCRYLDKHHGHRWALAFRALAGPAALARLLLLPLRRPARAATRAQAARALLAVFRGSWRGWEGSPQEPGEPSA